MLLPPIATHEAKGVPSNPPRSSNFAWFFLPACLITLECAYIALGKYVEISKKLFEGLDVNLPLPTRFLVANHDWLFSLLFLSAMGIVIVRLFVPLDKKRRMIFNWVFVGAGILGPALVILTMYLPVLELALKPRTAK
jgi:hypothetical protein